MKKMIGGRTAPNEQMFGVNTGSAASLSDFIREWALGPGLKNGLFETNVYLELYCPCLRVTRSARSPSTALSDSLRASTPAHPFPTEELRDPAQPEPVRRTGVSVWALGAGELQGLVALGASAFRGLGRPPHRGARLSPQLAPHLSQFLSPREPISAEFIQTLLFHPEGNKAATSSAPRLRNKQKKPSRLGSLGFPQTARLPEALSPQPPPPPPPTRSSESRSETLQQTSGAGPGGRLVRNEATSHPEDYQDRASEGRGGSGG
ncbi:uncharacterized protein [Kogia breviceps]|uniref:uncharacterized protein n=1 Tax=Kogia breviceps TaxID=27615 RepID=UPI0034D32BFA